MDDNFNLFIKYYSINNLGENKYIISVLKSFCRWSTLCKDCSSKESIYEPVGSNYCDFFRLKTKNFPITEIFRIYNKTTGEIYNPIYAFNNEVTFSGSKNLRVFNA